MPCFQWVPVAIYISPGYCIHNHSSRALTLRLLASCVPQIGVDLNFVSQTAWMATQLQFVPGLGPRKALALLKWVQRQDHVNARRPLFRDVGSPLGKKVFW